MWCIEHDISGTYRGIQSNWAILITNYNAKSEVYILNWGSCPTPMKVVLPLCTEIGKLQILLLFVGLHEEQKCEVVAHYWTDESYKKKSEFPEIESAHFR